MSRQSDDGAMTYSSISRIAFLSLSPALAMAGSWESFKNYGLGFILLLGILVFIHELGHFLFCKLFNVKVETFSIGFGPKILKFKKGETQYALSIIPLGGYVKMLGEQPGEEIAPELKSRSLNAQTKWRRFWIVFGGPLFNFILAVPLFAVVAYRGEEQLAAVVSRVTPGSFAETIGFKEGDKIVRVNENLINTYQAFAETLQASPRKQIELGVERLDKNGAPELLTITTVAQEDRGLSKFGEKIMVGSIPGISPIPLGTLIGVSDPKSPAALAGIKTFEGIIGCQGKDVRRWHDLEQCFAAAPKDSKISLRVVASDGLVSSQELKGENGSAREVVLSCASLTVCGIKSAELFVMEAPIENPAFKAGIRRGDRIIAVDDMPVSTFEELQKRVQNAGKNPAIRLKIEREGKLSEFSMAAIAQETDLGTMFMLGIRPPVFQVEPAVVVVKEPTVFGAIKKGFISTNHFIGITALSIKKMITGNISLKQVGGPIAIGKIAGQSFGEGLTPFLRLMAIISINLGLLNLLPIPVLDGGHLVLLGFELVNRKPLSARKIEIAQQVGFGFLMLLMGLAFFNDFTHHIFK